MKYAHPLAITIFAWIPYILVTWGYAKWTDGDAKTFWTALCVLLAIRLFFYIIETLGDVLSWRLYRRKIMVDNAVTALRTDKFPPREYNSDDLGNYLARIEQDPQYPATLRNAAVNLDQNLATIEQYGILVGARAWEVWEAALDIYSPRSKAPPFSFKDSAPPSG